MAGGAEGDVVANEVGDQGEEEEEEKFGERAECGEGAGEEVEEIG